MNCPHWLLALTIPFSRSDRARTSPEALVPGGPKDCSGQIAPLASFLRLPEGPEGPFGGEKTLPDRHGTVNAPQETSTVRAEARGRLPGASYRGALSSLADGIRCQSWERALVPRRRASPVGGLASPGPGAPKPPCLLSGEGPAAPTGGMRGTTRPLACHPVLEAQRAFRSRRRHRPLGACAACCLLRPTAGLRTAAA